MPLLGTAYLRSDLNLRGEPRDDPFAIVVGQFSRWMGAPLVLIYVVYVVAQFVISKGAMPGSS